MKNKQFEDILDFLETIWKRHPEKFAVERRANNRIILGFSSDEHQLKKDIDNAQIAIMQSGCRYQICVHKINNEWEQATFEVSRYIFPITLLAGYERRFEKLLRNVETFLAIRVEYEKLSKVNNLFSDYKENYQEQIADVTLLGE